jgi:poly(3-hydroxybutyrate) depolymerase
MSHIQALRRKFEVLLEAAREKATRFGKPPAHPKTRLQEATAFGPNPGNLRMLVHVPERLPSMAPLVVALHGCNQTADEYDYGTGWSSLANRLGFAVVIPSNSPGTILRIVFLGSCRATFPAGMARRSPSSKWSSTQ